MSTKFIKNSKSANLVSELRKEFGERVQENCSLSSFVQTKVGGVGECVFVAKTIEEIVKACRIALDSGRPYAVVGGGTGTLASHVGSIGVVVINSARQIHFSESNSLVVVESGVTNSSLVSAAASRGLGGLEFLIGIPGTVGGAIATQAFYGERSLRSYIRSVVLWLPSASGQQIVTVGALEAEQLLKAAANVHLKVLSPIILAVHLQFSRLYPEEIVRRLGLYRTRVAQIQSNSAVVGTPFRPLLKPEPALTKALGRLKHRGLKFDYSSQLVITGRALIQPQSYRVFLNDLQRLAAEYGQTLEDRLTYLGYWPDEGEHESF